MEHVGQFETGNRNWKLKNTENSVKQIILARLYFSQALPICNFTKLAGSITKIKYHHSDEFQALIKLFNSLFYYALNSCTLWDVPTLVGSGSK